MYSCSKWQKNSLTPGIYDTRANKWSVELLVDRLRMNTSRNCGALAKRVHSLPLIPEKMVDRLVLLVRRILTQLTLETPTKSTIV